MSEEAKQLQARRLRVEEKARAAIEQLAGSDLAAAASVLRVGKIEVSEDQVETAALQMEQGFSQAKFKIVLNAEFCDRPQRDVQAIMLHELLHHVMRHLEEPALGPNRMLCNVVQDAFINRTIHLASSELAQFMAEYYQEDQMPGLMLRPDSKPDQDNQQLYQALYRGQLTERDLYLSMQETVAEEQLKKVQLIGSHHDGQAPAISLPQATEVMEELVQQLGRRGQGASREAGSWQEMLQKGLRIEAAKRQSLLERAFRRSLCEELGSAEGSGSGGQRRSPLMPQRPERADLYWLMAGLAPLLWRRPDKSQSAATAVYIDVSGSMDKSVQLIYSSCLALKDLLATEIFLFSNKIAQIDLEEMKQGVMETTWGTDFDCVAEHILQRPHFSKAVLFTDGFASIKPELEKQLARSGQLITAVLTDQGSDHSMGFCDSIIRMPKPLG